MSEQIDTKTEEQKNIIQVDISNLTEQEAVGLHRQQSQEY
jgi:hypothetical protein